MIVVVEIKCHKTKRHKAVIDTKFGERVFKSAQKTKLMPVQNVTSDMIRHCKAAQRKPHNENTPKIDPIHIFRLQKQERQANSSANSFGNNQKQNDPKEHYDLIFLNIDE